MPGPEVTPDLIAALASGVLSAISPCAWPVVLAMLALTAQTALKPILGKKPGLFGRLMPIHIPFLCAGFGLVFFLLGLPTTWLGYWTWALQDTLRMAGAVVWFALGVSLLRSKSKAGWAPSLVAGAALALAWQPCPGRVLTVITIMVGNGQLASTGQWLLGGYALGQTMVLFLIALAFYQLLDILPKESRTARWLGRLSAVAVLAVGIMMFFNIFDWLTLSRANFFPL